MIDQPGGCTTPLRKRHFDANAPVSDRTLPKRAVQIVVGFLLLMKDFRLRILSSEGTLCLTCGVHARNSRGDATTLYNANDDTNNWDLLMWLWTLMSTLMRPLPELRHYSQVVPSCQCCSSEECKMEFLIWCCRT